MQGLILHAGANAATRERVREVQTPEARETWVPIGHEDFISMAVATLERRGLRVVEEGHGLWGKDGSRYFGVLQVQNGFVATDYGMLVGLRNSHDQTFPAGLAIGSRVFVCDNMAFSGEVVLKRRHTREILRDLPNLVDRAIERLLSLGKYQAQRIAAYKEYELDVLDDGREVHDLVIRSLDAGVIGPRRIQAVLQNYRQPQHEDFQPRDLWSLFNAYTEALKGSGSTLPDRTMKLHRLFDAQVGIEAPPAATEVVEDGEIRDNRVGVN